MFGKSLLSPNSIIGSAKRHGGKVIEGSFHSELPSIKESDNGVYKGKNVDHPTEGLVHDDSVIEND